MSGRVEKIQIIKRMAVFRNFNWDSDVRDTEDNIVEFEDINIIYGHNYSGKTTLSRILRALETGVISDKYKNPEFSVSFEDKEELVSQNMLDSHGQAGAWGTDFR